MEKVHMGSLILSPTGESTHVDEEGMCGTFTCELAADGTPQYSGNYYLK